LAGSLATNRAGVTYNELAVVQPPGLSETAERNANEALQISKEIGWLAGESFALWILSLNSSQLGRFSQALAMAENGLQIATEIDHRQWMAGHEFVLGVLYCEILSIDEARQHAERALELARETGSQYWTNQAAGALAMACLLQGELAQCRSTLSRVLTPSTPMDSHAKRFCWLQRGELALTEGDPELALDIVARLVDSIPGLTGNVIPSLWRLHAESLTAVKQYEQAESVLQAAVQRISEGHPKCWRLYAAMADLYWHTNRQMRAEEASAAGRAYVSKLAASISDEQLRENFQQRAYRRLSLSSS